MANINDVINSLSDEELDLLNSDPEMLVKFKAKYMTPEADNRGALAEQITKAALPGPAQAVQSAMTAPQPVQEALIRGAATEAGQLTGGPIGAGLGAASANIAIDLAKSPAAQDAMLRMGKAAVTGQPAEMALAPTQAVAKNPEAVKESLKNSAIQGGAAALMSGLLSGAKKVMQPTGPGTAGFNAPETTLPGNLERTGKAVGAAKSAAFAGEDLGNLPELMASPAGIRKLGKAARDVAAMGDDEISSLPNSQLVALRSAAGKMAKAGGEFADEYSKAQKAITNVLQEKAPELLKAKYANHLAKLAKGTKGENSIPFFIGALSPAAGAVKTAMMAPVRNAAGAALRVGMETAVPAAPVVSDLSQKALQAALQRLNSLKGK